MVGSLTAKPIGFTEVVVALVILALATAVAEIGALILGRRRSRAARTSVPESEEKTPSMMLDHFHQDIHLEMCKTKSMNDALEWFLCRIMQIPGLHCSAVYLKREEGRFDLVAHQGFSADFVQEKGCLEPHQHSQEEARVLDFTGMMEDHGNHAELLDGLRASVETPVLHQGEKLAVLKVGSRTVSAIEPHTVVMIQRMASYMGPIIARFDDPEDKPGQTG